MSDVYDYEAEAYDQLAMMEQDNTVDEFDFADNYPYRRKKAYVRDPFKDTYHDVVVNRLHAETEKAYCISATVQFPFSFYGTKEFNIVADWFPKSVCVATGNMIRIPHWLLKRKIEEYKARHRQVAIDIPF